MHDGFSKKIENNKGISNIRENNNNKGFKEKLKNVPGWADPCKAKRPLSEYEKLWALEEANPNK